MGTALRESLTSSIQTGLIKLLVAALEPPAQSESEQRQPANDSEAAQTDTDEPEGYPRDDPHQGVDREIADDGARGERDQGDRW